MAFRVTYKGKGVATNALGAFQYGTIAYTDNEDVARTLALDLDFEVLTPGGASLRGDVLVKEAGKVSMSSKIPSRLIKPLSEETEEGDHES